MAWGNNGQRIFLKYGDYEAFLEAHGNVRGLYPFYLYGCALMSNHFTVVNSPTARIILLEGVARENSLNMQSEARGTPTERASGEIGRGAGPFYLPGGDRAGLHSC